METYYIRPAWDCDGNEAFIVIQKTYKPELLGESWDAWISYAPMGSKVLLGQLAGTLETVKKTASRKAREHLFTPRGVWREVTEE